jgi:hypothetical protein
VHSIDCLVGNNGAGSVGSSYMVLEVVEDSAAVGYVGCVGSRFVGRSVGCIVDGLVFVGLGLMFVMLVLMFFVLASPPL